MPWRRLSLRPRRRDARRPGRSGSRSADPVRADPVRVEAGEVARVGVVGEVGLGQASVAVVVAGDRDDQLEQSLAGQRWWVVLGSFSSPVFEVAVVAWRGSGPTARTGPPRQAVRGPAPTAVGGAPRCGAAGRATRHCRGPRRHHQPSAARGAPAPATPVRCTRGRDSPSPSDTARRPKSGAAHRLRRISPVAPLFRTPGRHPNPTIPRAAFVMLDDRVGDRWRSTRALLHALEKARAAIGVIALPSSGAAENDGHISVRAVPSPYAAPRCAVPAERSAGRSARAETGRASLARAHTPRRSPRPTAGVISW
jgi:hypothetical protein